MVASTARGDVFLFAARGAAATGAAATGAVAGAADVSTVATIAAGMVLLSGSSASLQLGISRTSSIFKRQLTCFGKLGLLPSLRAELGVFNADFAVAPASTRSIGNKIFAAASGLLAGGAKSAEGAAGAGAGAGAGAARPR